MLRYVLRFMAIGALLFAARSAWTALQPLDTRAAIVREPIEVSSELIERLSREAIAQTGRAADERELQLRAEVWIDEEILYREARLVGLQHGDPVIAMRLVRNMRFVDDDPERSDDELYEEALGLGMDESDLVVRRRLVQQMRFIIEAPADLEAIADAELRAYLAANPERFAIPPRVRLTQLHLSRDRRGPATESDAVALLETLRKQVLGPEQSTLRGDPFLHPAHQPLQSERQLAKHFGPGFAQRVSSEDLALGAWLGPIESAYGAHIVWLHEHQPSHPPELASVRAAVEGQIRSERRRQLVADQLAKLHGQYLVVWPEGWRS